MLEKIIWKHISMLHFCCVSYQILVDEDLMLHIQNSEFLMYKYLCMYVCVYAYAWQLIYKQYGKIKLKLLLWFKFYSIYAQTLEFF